MWTAIIKNLMSRGKAVRITEKDIADSKAVMSAQIDEGLKEIFNSGISSSLF